MNYLQPNYDYIFHSKLLRDNLKKIFGVFDEAILNEIENQLVWIELEGGKLLIKEGDIGDSLYFVLSGRLSATKVDEKGKDVKIGEVIRGETVGEMAIFTGEPRYASITAIRDSVLVQLSKALFETIISEYPEVALNVTRMIIERLKNNNKKKLGSNTVNLCFLSIHDSIQSDQIVSYIYEYISKSIDTYFLDESVVKSNGFKIRSDDQNGEGALENKKLTQWLNNMEAQHEFMVFKCNHEVSVWNTKCLRQADHIILLADATRGNEVTAIEEEVLNLSNVNISLALVHPKDTDVPEGTIGWLNARPTINQHFHLRSGSHKEMERMARILTGKATGLVLAGGGAKGFAHIGVYKALEELNIPIDYVGGTSVGSMIAAAIAFDKPAAVTEELLRKGTHHKPSSDFSFFPIISLVKGVNIKRMITDTIKCLSGKSGLNICDTWLPMYAVASNFTKSEQATFFRGPLVKVLLASSAIPGIFPPVILDGDLYVDGGTFNNFPADIMRALQMRNVIGVDFMMDKTRQLTLEDMPSNMDMLKNKIYRKKGNKIRVPNIGSIIINSTLMYSNAKRHETKNFLDLHFNPDVSRFGLTAWTDYDKIVEKGYLHAKDMLSSLTDEELSSYRNPM